MVGIAGDQTPSGLYLFTFSFIMRCQPASDLWALGAVLVERLLGFAPFQAQTAVAVKAKIDRVLFVL